MSFYYRYRSDELRGILRDEDGPLRGVSIRVEIDFVSEELDRAGQLVPEKAIAALDARMHDLFDGALMISQQDPHADDLVKLKRLKLARPVLFDHGTSGAQLAFYLCRSVDEWVRAERWNAPEGSDAAVSVALATIEIDNRSAFFAT